MHASSHKEIHLFCLMDKQALTYIFLCKGTIYNQGNLACTLYNLTSLIPGELKEGLPNQNDRQNEGSGQGTSSLT